MLTLLPLDDFTIDPVRFMQVVGKPDEVPPAVADMQVAIRNSGFAGGFVSLERFAFYGAARAAFGVIQCGDARFYGNVLLRRARSRHPALHRRPNPRPSGHNGLPSVPSPINLRSETG